MFRRSYGDALFEGDDNWKGLEIPDGDRYAWDDESTYVKQPPYFEDMPAEAPEGFERIEGAKVLAVLGDSVTTAHISPAGAIKKDSPAGEYLIERGVEPREFNSYGSRRGNHEVMMRGTFANIRLRNLLAPDTEGGFTKKDGEAAESLGLTGEETFDLDPLEEGAKTLKVTPSNGKEFDARVRIDTPNEWLYYRHDGILHLVLRDLLQR